MRRSIGILLLALFVTSPFAAAQDVTLRVLGRFGTGSVIYRAIAAFEEAHPGVHVEIEDVSFNEYMQKLRVQYAAGIAPDIVFPATYQVIELAVEGALLPLDDYVDEAFLAEFVPHAIGLYTYEGSLYALPNDMAALAVYINTDHFDEAGLWYDFTTWSWDEFLESLRKLTADRNGDGLIDRFGLEHLGYMQPFIWSATGHQYFDDVLRPTRLLLGEPEALEAYQFIQDLRWVHHVVPQPGEAANFIGGTASTTMGGHWSMASINNAGLNWQLIALPYKNYQVQRGDGTGISVMRTTRYPELAAALVKWLAGEEGQTMMALEHFGTSTYLPVLHGVWRNPPDLPPHVNKMAFLTGTDHLFSNYEVHHPVNSAVWAHINAAQAAIFDRTASPEQAIAQIEEPIRAILREAGLVE